jgi:hypothetical protein
MSLNRCVGRVGASALLAAGLLYPAAGTAADGRATSAGPLPRTAEGRPDLTGIWAAKTDPKSQKPALTAAGVAALQKLQKSTPARCLPGSPLIGAGVYKLVQTPALLIVMFKDLIGYRQVFLDGRPHPKDADPSWLGHSIGHWEGDTLVVDTIGLNDRSRLQIYPHTEKLHLSERYRRRDLGHLEVRILIEDPDSFARPWKLEAELSLAPNQELSEYVCEENSSAVSKN